MSGEMTIRIEPSARGVRAMARELGVSVSHLSRVVRGKRTPGKRLEGELRRRGYDCRVLMARMIERHGVAPGEQPVFGIEHGTCAWKDSGA